jgi:2,3-bisphosphoglycerate-dependent phosphoglycerate mutase
MDRRSLVLLRHGRSRADDEQVHEGRYDSPLTDVGRNQARRLGDHWARTGMTFDRIVCSSLVRARETAEIVARALAMDSQVEVSDLWMEHDNGPLAGLSAEEADVKFPPPAFRSRWAPLTPAGGESTHALHRRAAEALEWVLNGDVERTLVVAHGGILNAALRVLLGASFDTHFAFGDNGCAELAVSATSHDVALLSFGPSPAAVP